MLHVGAPRVSFARGRFVTLAVLADERDGEQLGVHWLVAPPSTPFVPWAGRVLEFFLGMNATGIVGWALEDVTSVLGAPRRLSFAFGEAEGDIVLAMRAMLTQAEWLNPATEGVVLDLFVPQTTLLGAVRDAMQAVTERVGAETSVIFALHAWERTVADVAVVGA